MRTPQTRTILALDPGLQELGYAVLSGRKLVDQGVVPLKLVKRARRMPAARSAIRQLVQRHQPTDLVVEHTHRYPNGLHRLVPMVRRIAKDRRLRLAIYSPRTVRKAVVGYGWANKAEAAAAMTLRYPVLRIYRTQDRKWKERYWWNMYDAVALATHHRLLKPSS